MKRENESLCIAHLASVEAEGPLIEVAEKVKRFDAHMRSVETSLQKTPEVFNVGRVNAPINVLDGVANHLMRAVNPR